MLYEFQMHFHITDMIKIFFVLLPVMIWVVSMEWHIAIKTILRIISILFFVFWLCGVVMYPFVQYDKIKDAIKDNNIFIVEGEIEDFHTPDRPWNGHDSERFYVSGILFAYNGDENYGYCKILYYGGVIKGNGQKIRITYYKEYGRNVICSIEALN